ncbi:MAG: right-handed parallel beta-helix repeat-containing protein [Limisphaerales bacterium]|jgi:hypothetical protein|nr:right-handed parallel beta-helix repeat-containing protein [Verrucomicrobiota bacterium]
MKKFFSVFTLLSLGACTLFGIDFYISPEGSDANSGSSAEPFATLQKAQMAVRAFRSANPKEPVTVNLVPGVYELEQKLLFTPEDSGISEEAPVRYVSSGGGEVVVSGGSELALEWEKDANIPGVWKAKVELRSGKRFEQLWVNGRRAVRARTPDYWSFARLLGVSEEDIPGKEATKLHTFKAENLITSTLKGLSETELSDVQIHVIHKWDTTREWLTGVEPDKGVMTSEGRKMLSHNMMTRDNQYYLENYKSALDAPGEWFLDREGWLYYYPLEGEDIKSSEFVYPRLETLLKVAGEWGKSRVRFIEFEGIHFKHSKYQVPQEGVPPMQAAMNCQQATLFLNSAEAIHFNECSIEHTGNVGLWIKADSAHCSVTSSRIFDIGATAVRIGETQNRAKEQRTGFITIHNCIIQSSGRIHPSATGVWIGQSSDNRITHNEISDHMYTGVSVGWVWGYAESGSQRNLVAYNHIHHIGYRILSDMGGIYTLGNSVGTVLRGNHIHDVYSSAYGGWGLYPDEGTTGMLLDDNLVYNTKDGGFHQHYGRDNIVRNNIFAFSEEGQIAVTRAEAHTSFIFENNIVVFDEGRLLGYGGWAAGAKVKMNNNLYWNSASKAIDFAGKTFDEWKAAGHDRDSLIADPLFENVEERDFRLKKGSPAEKIGFKAFDFTKAGVQGNAEWVRLAKSLEYPGFGKTYEPPPLSFKEDFEEARFSTLKEVSSFHEEDRSGLIGLSDKYAASGKYSLLVQDDPELKFSYNPHFYFDPHYTEGVLKFSYKILLKKGVVTHNEIRSEGHPYLTGPSLFFRDGGLNVREQKLLDLPYEEWIGIEITAPLGAKAKGEWSLKVSLPDDTEKTFQELPCDSRWNRARWLGFCALENTSSAFYLDDIELELIP